MLREGKSTAPRGFRCTELRGASLLKRSQSTLTPVENCEHLSTCISKEWCLLGQISWCIHGEKIGRFSLTLAYFKKKPNKKSSTQLIVDSTSQDRYICAKYNTMLYDKTEALDVNQNSITQDDYGLQVGRLGLISNFSNTVPSKNKT